ncbi:hypothetical protein KM043_004394 [Ampulex compressa]|nr:hypothetical protein KM043_004394 [Ampulex compressa]
MSAVYPTLPKLSVRDSIDDEDLTDIDDEVFIRDGRNGSLKIDDDGGVKRPLMAPRRRCKKTCNFESYRFPYRALFVPFCYGLLALVILIGLIILCIFTANIFPMPLNILKNWLTRDLKHASNQSNVIPCTSLATKILWTRSLPKLTSESPLRSNDVDGDGIEDIIVGFSTGLDTMDAPEYICTLYFGSQMPCLGGVLALNGKTGETFWTHWTAHAIFSVDCGVDLTNDKIKDCVVSGRGGILHAVNGHDGFSIWELPVQDASISGQQKVLDVYDAKFITDTDGDGIGDIIASHAIQAGGIRSSEILIISGSNGNIIHSVPLPNTEQLFLAPQTLVHPDGENIFILATSSQKQSGGLYAVPQVNLMYGDLKLRKLHHNTGKGVLLPPILVDITSDGVEDIVAAMFNSTIMAYNGLTFEPIWNYTVPNSEVISIPIPGYYNDDDIPDFMVKHQVGAGFPMYYYTVATIIDGRTGQSILENPMEDSLSRQMSGLSVTVEGFGNDWFLHWSADCLNYKGVKEKYQFLKSQSLVSQTHADLCKLRFNSSLTTNLLALSQHVGPPGISLYYSEDWKSLEFNNSVDPRKEAETYLAAHPGLKISDTFADMPLLSERSPELHKTHDKESVFRHRTDDIITDMNGQNADMVYENYGDYKGHDKPSISNFESVNDNPDGEKPWKRRNKWSGENIQTDKEYDDSYDGDGEGNLGDDQEIDYPQISDVREQRSNPNLFNLSLDNTDSIPQEEGRDRRLEKRQIYIPTIEINSHVKEDATPLSLSMSVTNVFISNNTYNVSTEESNFEVGPESMVNGSAIEEEIKFEYNETRSEVSTFSIVEATENITNNVTNHEYEISSPVPHTQKFNDTDTFVKPASQSQMYVHNFPDLKNYEDANIEQVFKRESLKNQNEGYSSRISGSSKSKKQRVRREAQTETDQANRLDGVQRQPPTGILLPTISELKGRTAVDLVFSTFWLPSSEVSVILLQDDLDCINRKKVLSENKLQYKESDDIIKECLSERGINYKSYQEATDRENVKIALGQMTIYRMKLECVCPEDMLPNQTCRNISSHQSWPEHLGLLGNGYFKPMHRPNI